MNIRGFKKDKLPGLWYSRERREAIVQVHRPERWGGGRGRDPWWTRLFGVSLDEAREREGAFRRYCLENGRRPDDEAAGAPVAVMPTFAQYVQRWWPIGRLSPKWARESRYMLDACVVPALGSHPLDRITRAALEGLQSSLRADGQAAGTPFE